MALMDGPCNLYQQIVESAHEGIWIHDLQGQTTYANGQMADLLRYPLPEMRELSLFDVLDEPGRQQAAQMLARERQRPLTEQVDCLYIRKDGSSVWCLVGRSPLLDGDGRHIGSINLVSDITDRKLVDEELRRSGDLLAEAQRVAHLGSWVWDIIDDEINWSDEMYQILDVPTTTALTYQKYLDSVHPDDRDHVNRLVGRCIDGERDFSYECRIVRPTGQVVWIHAQGQAVVDATGTLRSIRGTVLDITAYKKAEEKVQRTSARYRLLQRMATEANEDTGFEYVLQLAVHEILLHTGWSLGRAYLASGSPPQLVNAPLVAIPGSLLAVNQRDDVPSTVLPGRVIDSGHSIWMAPLDDVGTSVQLSGQPLQFGAGFAFPVPVAGEVVAVLEFLSERTAGLDEELLETCAQVATQLARVVERQRAADDLAAARDAAMESLRVKSEFLATMSHEIRTPMNGVIGLTGLLLDTELDDRQRQYAEGVQTSGAALLTLINDILDFSKLEAGKVELDDEDFDVRRILEQVSLLLGPAAHAKGLELLASCLPDVPAVLVGDSGRIRQVILNFVSNGVKFAGSGEVVTTLTSELLGEGRVRLRCEVRDTGIGIPEESRDRLFESFSQADASTTRRYGGTGLGLAISQRLVEAMGGVIGFDSEVGVGSTFWFEIPLMVGSGLPAQTVVRLPALMSDLRVLVVEDNPLNQLVAEGMVTTLGYSVDIVDNGAEALTAILHTSYSAVLMDCHMPVLDGYEATREIRRREAGGPRMPVIAMTAGAMDEDRQRCARAGMDDFVSKPVTMAAVGAALAHWARPRGTEPAHPEAATEIDTAQPVWEAEPVLDLNRIAQLRQLGSRAESDLLGRVTTLFARDGPGGLADVRASVAGGSLEALHQALHKLKGTSSTVGAIRLAALCYQLEGETQQDVTALTSQRLRLLELELDRATDAISRAG